MLFAISFLVWHISPQLYYAKLKIARMLIENHE